MAKHGFFIPLMLVLAAVAWGGAASSPERPSQGPASHRTGKEPAMEPERTQTYGKNIILCLDGTNNEFGRTNTNVVRLYQALDRTPAAGQAFYYDPGVGTLAPPNLVTRIGQATERSIDKAFGAGIVPKVEEAVCFLMRTYEPGDRVYIFGFSRGAYAARVLAALLYKSGLPEKDADNLVPYFTRNLENTTDWQVSKQFRATFGRPCPVHFLGLWDTVSSVGWIYNPTHFPYTRHNPGVAIVRHAVALDERRTYFRTNLWETPQAGERQDCLEVWFPGVHSDVGGGYAAADGSLWKLSFQWMVPEAARSGLIINEQRVAEFLGATPPAAGQEWFRAPAHESLRGAWWLGEFLPKKYWDERARPPRYRFLMPRGRARVVPAGALLHRSIIERMRADGTYRPRNLDKMFIDQVVRAQPATELIPYHPETDHHD